MLTFLQPFNVMTQVAASHPRIIDFRQPNSLLIIIHNVSLMDRWRYYWGLSWHLPPQVTAQALALGFMLMTEWARQLLIR